MIIASFIASFAYDHAEFLHVSKEQTKQGYVWNYRGVTEPDGSPAIKLFPPHGDEYVIWKLELDK